MKQYLFQGPFWDGFRSVARWFVYPLFFFVVACLIGNPSDGLLAGAFFVMGMWFNDGSGK